MIKLEPSRITDIYKISIRKGYKNETTREQNALIFMLSGESIYAQSGKQIVCNGNRCVLLPKNSHYSIEVTESGECYVLYFDTSRCIGDELGAFWIDSPEEACDILCETAQAFALMKPGFEHLMMSSFHKLLYIMSDCPDDGRAVKLEVLRPAIEYLEQNLSDCDTSNQTLAALCGKSTSYFRKLFMEIYRIPPAKYVQTMKLNRAKQLLLEGNLSISEIAEKTGFTSVYYFDAAFKNETGCSPSEFIRSALSGL